MGNPRKSPPKFSVNRCYEKYRAELIAWIDIAEYDRKQIAQVIALDMPTSDAEGDIRGKIFEDIGDQIKDENGIAVLTNWLDKHYRVDQIARVVEKIKSFLNTKRKKDESITAYLSNFDVAYNALNRAGTTKLPQSFLMYYVLENAGLTETQRQMVMAGVDTIAAGTLYDQARTSVVKIMGMHSHDKKDTFEYKDANYGEDVLYGGRSFSQRGVAGQFPSKPWRPEVAPYQPRHPYNPNQKTGGGLNSSKIKLDVPMNPIGRDGKRTLCTICNSWSHYRAKCPYNPVNYVGPQTPDLNHFEVNYVPNEEGPEEVGAQGQGDQLDELAAMMANMNKTDKADENFYATLDSFVVMDVEDVLKTDFGEYTDQVKVVGKFGTKEELGKVVLDTGCISNVTGTGWFMSYTMMLSPMARSKVTFKPSSKVFKFGGGTTKQSLGCYKIPCSVGGKNVALEVDVVDQKDLPCLLSQESMRKAGAILNFPEETITLFGMEVKMKRNEGGHPTIQLGPYKDEEKEKTEVLVTENGEHREVLWQLLDGVNEDEDFKRIMSMHEGLGHPGQKVFTEMLKSQISFNANVQKIVNKIYEQCVSCIKHKVSKPRPHVSPPMAKDFNDTLCVDLKIWPSRGTIVLYMIDMFSRYTDGVEVENKKADTILVEILDQWIMKWGPPRQILFDNGSEFSNSKMREMCEKMNIQMLTTGAYSPFQNGLCEKNHHVVDLMIDKMMTGDKDLTVSRALKGALFAKNSLTTVNGFSPLQLVTGKQPRIPGAAQDNMAPANSTGTDHKLTHERISDIFGPRKAFIEVENSNRLKRALRHRGTKPEVFDQGERVFYRVGLDVDWHGPGKVVAQDGKVIFIRHGQRIISTSPSRVQKVPQPEKDNIVSVVPTIDPSNTRSQEAVNQRRRDEQISANDDSESDDSDSETDDIVPNRRIGLDSDDDSDMDVDFGQSPELGQRDNMNTWRPWTNDLEEEDFRPRDVSQEGEGRDSEERQPGQEEGQEGEKEVHEEVEVQEKRKGRMPSKGNWIIWKEKESQYFFRAQVIQRVTKGTVKKNRHFNIMNKNGEKSCINLDKVDWELIKTPEGMASPEIIPADFKAKKRRRSGLKAKKGSPRSPDSQDTSSPVAKKVYKPSTSIHTLINYRCDQIEYTNREEMNRALVTMIPKQHWDQPAVIEAKKRELENFERHKAFEWVRDIGQPRISSGWVITPKQFGDVMGVKARLVCHGNQEASEHQSDAPTSTKLGLRMLFTICTQMGWSVMSADVTSAFLQAKITRDVFVRPPKDQQRPGMIWRLLRAMYGLDDASLLWYKTVEEEMIKLGCQKLQSDPAIFFYHHPTEKTLQGIVGWHVDDLNGGGSELFYTNVMKPLMEKFQFGSVETDNFRCLGWNIEHSAEGSIYVSQRDYADAKVDYLDLDKGELTSKDLVKEEDIPRVRGHIGKIRWMADQSRLDIAFEALLLSMASHKPTYGDVTLINKVVARIKRMELKIKFSKLEGDRWTLTVFADASKGNLGKTGSTVAYLILLSDGYNKGEPLRKCNLLTWKSSKAKRVVVSTYDAEAMALNMGIQGALVIKSHLNEIMNWKEDVIDVEAFTDCKDVYNAVVANKPYPKGDQLASLDVAAVKRYKELGMLTRFEWVNTELMLADTLTKQGKTPDNLIEVVTKGRF